MIPPGLLTDPRDTSIGLAVIALAAAGIALHLIGRRLSASAQTIHQRYGIPAGRVVYRDLDRPGRTLYSKKHRIAGKPDYIVKYHGHLIPVEVKSAHASRPHENHVLQLASYCLLIEECYNTRVPYGILVYADGTEHRVEFDGRIRLALISTIRDMRARLHDGRASRNHSRESRCVKCRFREECGMAL